ncbi:MAG TPA: XdhC family protein [Candidatus Cybelea sp.]|jgi:xanthine dehydrogenase accessory factor|nr:XdhC family protein [Candidatus Cybelea sp.]
MQRTNSLGNVRNVFAIAAEWLEQNRPFALGTLVALRDAATAPIGTTVAVDAQGCVFGNIGAGCYEAEIVEACVKTAHDGQMRRVDIDLTSNDELSGTTGCGATMGVLVWRPQAAFRSVARAIATGERDVRLIVEGNEERDGSHVAFEHVFAQKERLILVGATALAGELAALARRLDFHVVVVDPRPAFATTLRVPDACEIVRAWPDEYLPGVLSEHTPIVMLSHDPKFDLAGLHCALESNAPYIGLLGSRRSQAARRASLRAAGVEERALARIHGPVGLELGGTSLPETALSILAEVVAVRHGAGGRPLRSGRGAIHRQLEGLPAGS